MTEVARFLGLWLNAAARPYPVALFNPIVMQTDYTHNDFNFIENQYDEVLAQ